MTVLIVPASTQQEADAWAARCRRGLLAWLADDGILAVPPELLGQGLDLAEPAPRLVQGIPTRRRP